MAFSMKSILDRFFNVDVGINLNKPFKVEIARLNYVGDDYFSVVDYHDGCTHYFSFQCILQIIEHQQGVNVGGFFTHKEYFPIVVKVAHIQEYIPIG